MSIQLIKVDDNNFVGNVRIEHKKEQVFTNERYAIVAIDCSGSMAGIPFRYALKGLETFLIENIDNFKKIYVIMYETNTKQFFVTKESLAEGLRRVRAMCAGGCTNFIKMYNEVSNIIDAETKASNGKLDMYVCVFSDGKHYVDARHALGIINGYYDKLMPEQIELIDKFNADDVKNLEVARNRFNESIQSPAIRAAGGRSWVVTRAFSRDVDVLMMELLTHFGTEAGDFQYAFTSDEIKNIITNDDRLNKHTVSGDLDTSKHVHRIEFQHIDENVFESTLFLEASDVDNNDFKFTMRNNVNTLLVYWVNDTKENAIQIFDAFLSSFANSLQKISSDLVRNSTNKVISAEIIKEFQKLDKQSSKAYDFRFGMLKGRLARKKYGTLYTELRKEMNALISTANQIVRGNANTDLAKLLHAGHTIGRSGLQRRVDKLKLAGVAKLEDAESKLIALGATINESEIENKLADAPYQCMISLSTTADAVKDLDVMCITGNMTRPEAAVADSSRLRFVELHSNENTLLWSVFEDSLLSKLSGMDYNTMNEHIHGGFNVKSKVNQQGRGVIVNAYRGTLNFAYPLYICAEHWQVAKLTLPKIVAWMSTLDFAAQTFEQIKMVPFTLVAFAIKTLMDKATFANIQSFMNVARVARQVVVDFNLKHVHEDFTKWVAGYDNRVPKAVANLQMFLTKIMFMKEMPELDNGFWASVFEESIRRMQSKEVLVSEKFVADQSNYMDYVVNANGDSIDELQFARAIDKNAVVETKNEYVAPVFDANKIKTDTPEIKKFIEYVMSKTLTTASLIITFRKFYEFFRVIDRDELFKKFDEAFGYVNDETMKFFEPLIEQRMNEMSNGNKRQDVDMFEDFGIDNTQLYSMIVQNQLDSDNSARETTRIDNIDVRDPIETLKGVTERVIQAEQTRRNQAVRGNEETRMTELFARTTDRNVAAGIVKVACVNVGAPIFHMLLKKLQELERIPDRAVKIMMIVDGQWRGLQLYRPGFCYPANKRNRKRLIFADNWQRKLDNEPIRSNDYWNKIFKHSTAHWVQ